MQYIKVRNAETNTRERKNEMTQTIKPKKGYTLTYEEQTILASLLFKAGYTVTWTVVKENGQNRKVITFSDEEN